MANSESPAQHSSGKKPHTQHEAPHAASQEASAHEIAAHPKTIQLSFVAEGQQESCQVWLGITKQGPLNPFELMQIDSISELFAKAAASGLRDNKPVLLADSKRSPARYLLFTPPPPTASESHGAWLLEIERMLEPIQAQSLGLYLDPRLLGEQLALALSADLIERLVQRKLCSTFQVLIAEHALNPLLRMGLALKALLKQKGLFLYLYH